MEGQSNAGRGDETAPAVDNSGDGTPRLRSDVRAFAAAA
ncbi:hypothetical protein Rumeso_03275 [Rubellimicrobium mesophilum DSM 19309]|uniref:Uncharacterized protein n=1 Tax=Rubellimicrobium mesophilum DSM 19309 TaxID=442562 RepID=A0A017HN22_9RHOB|nr:hypothetical protein Rumeso_03275 [Rubellimicrobium mesophilum DSM 19309]